MLPTLETAKEPYLRFSDEEIDGFLIFLLEGGADKRCSNVYRIIEQERDDIREARRLIRELMTRHRQISPSQLHQELHTLLQVLT